MDIVIHAHATIKGRDECVDFECAIGLAVFVSQDTCRIDKTSYARRMNEYTNGVEILSLDLKLPVSVKVGYAAVI